MNILLTGGTGLIGTALINHWLNQHKLIVLTRSEEKVKRLWGTKVSAETELSNIDFNQLDAVINLAGEPIAEKRWSAKQKQIMCHSRWQLTEKLVSCINKANTPPAILISGSAVGYYGRQQQQLISEDYQHIYDEFTHQLCKRWEELASAAAPTTRVCILRTGIVLASHGGALSKMLPAFRFGLGGRIGDGEQYMSWIHLDDIVGLTDFLLQHPTLQGPFNATAPNPVTNKEFSNMLAKQLGRPALLPMPAPVISLLLGEMADLLLSGQRVLPTNLVKAGYRFKYDTLAPALANLLP